MKDFESVRATTSASSVATSLLQPPLYVKLFRSLSQGLTCSKTLSNDVPFSYAIIPPAFAVNEPVHTTSIGAKTNQEKARETALLIDCNQLGSHIQHTIECALRTFPKENIFVIGNGNSDCPTNNTNRICTLLGVRHIWIPTRSKVAAQYVGIAAAYRFRYCLLIDEDVALPADFPVRIEWLETSHSEISPHDAPVKCIGYASGAIDEECRQTQKLEYQPSSLPQTFFDKFGEVGSASFPHGTISLWERNLLETCFHRHPGYVASPNWFLGINLALALQRRSIGSDNADKALSKGRT